MIRTLIQRWPHLTATLVVLTLVSLALVSCTVQHDTTPTTWPDVGLIAAVSFGFAAITWASRQGPR